MPLSQKPLKINHQPFTFESSTPALQREQRLRQQKYNNKLQPEKGADVNTPKRYIWYGVAGSLLFKT
jgi:hypothetical protein